VSPRRSGISEETDCADTIRVLIVDGDSAVRSSLQGVLRLHRGIGKIDTVPAAGFAVRRTVATRPHVCLIDYHLGGEGGACWRTD
jgi:DNA-binding NarL/FixJ family response regulator